MTINDIKQLLYDGESTTFEVKSASKGIPKSFWDTYSAFGNTNGGIIVLGVSETNGFDIIGVENPKKYIDDILSTARSNKVNYNLFTDKDSIIELTYDDKKIIVCIIPEAPPEVKPIYLDGTINKAYIRRGTGDHKINKDELSTMLRDANHELDRQKLNNYTIDDLDLTAILRYKNILHQRVPSRQFDTQDIDVFLENLDVFVFDPISKEKKLTLAGLLFFGKLNAIKSHIPLYHVDFFDKRGCSERWRDRVESEDLEFENLNLFNYYQTVFEKLKLSVERNFELDEQTVRKSPNDLLIALRESFVNMIVHADYLSSNPSLIVEIHEPYYIFLNPGKMKISKEEFFCGSRSIARNPILISLFQKMGAAERAGSGSQKIIDIVKKNSFKYPEIETSIEETKLKLWIAHLVDSLDLSIIEKDIYNVITNINFHPCTKKVIQKELPNYTEGQIRSSIGKLLDKNLILKQGGKRNRSYIKNVTSLEFIKTLEKFTERAKESFKSNAQ